MVEKKDQIKQHAHKISFKKSIVNNIKRKFVINSLIFYTPFNDKCITNCFAIVGPDRPHQEEDQELQQIHQGRHTCIQTVSKSVSQLVCQSVSVGK